MNDVRIITLAEADLGRVQMFCGHSPTYQAGYLAKLEWLRARLREGMRYTLLQVHGHNAGLLESIPAEAAWRGVKAQGYLFIHCFWVIGRNRGHGYGRQLLEACLEDARGMNGVALLSSSTHWLPTRKIFLKNGFTVVERSAPFELLVKRLNPEAPLPGFKQAAQGLPPGLPLHHSDQCPYMQNMPAIVEQVGRQLGIPVNITRLESAQQAQDSPCPYGVLGIFFNGELLEYRPTPAAKLLDLIKAKLEAVP
jgi:GNAT superfamily N-acetyltransferase